jgi:hypothetical protein
VLARDVAGVALTMRGERDITIVGDAGVAFSDPFSKGRTGDEAEVDGLAPGFFGVAFIIFAGLRDVGDDIAE